MNLVWPIVTYRTPIMVLQLIHREIWNHVIEHGYKPSTIYSHDCVACEYRDAIAKYLNDHGRPVSLNSCDLCPIKWPGPEKCNMHGNLYNTWALYDLCDVKDEVKSGIAKLIRDVEWKEDGYFD